MQVGQHLAELRANDQRVCVRRLRRAGVPEDIAGTIAFLCSEDASYISGQVIYVAGGPRT